MTTLFLGPAGSFCEQALGLLGLAGEPAPSVAASIDRVRDGSAQLALVPFESSVEGAVTVTLDCLADTSAAPVHVVAEVLVPVRFALLVRPGTGWPDVKSVASHIMGIQQCRRWLASHLPDASVNETPSTSGAAVAVAQGQFDAAMASPAAAAHTGLVPLEGDIADDRGAMTRFVLVGPPDPPPHRTGADRTTLVAYIRDNHSGALLEVLTELAVRGIDLTRLESRPTRTGLGRYCFSMDLVGHLEDARVAEALAGLRRVCEDVRFLGSYPRFDGTATEVRRGTADDDYAQAQAWVEGLRGPVDAVALSQG